MLGSIATVGPDGETTEITGHAGRLLVELVGRGPLVSRGRLLDALWPDERPKSADAALRVHLSRLRKLLDQTGARIERRAIGDELVGAATDLDRFDELVSQARSWRAEATDPAGLARASAAVDDALDLWRGEPFAPFETAPGVVDLVPALRSRRDQAEDLAVDLLLERGDEAGAIARLERAVLDRPFHERCWSRLMLAYYRDGRQRDALTAFERARRVMVDELGIEPGPALQRLQHEILMQDTSLERTTPSPDPAGPRPIGRDKEVGQVLAASKVRRTVTVTGPPGIGKSSVVRVAARAAETGPTVVLDAEAVATAELLPFALADALELRPDPAHGLDLVDVVAGRLSLTPTTLVIDGGEHLGPGVAQFAATMLERIDDLRIIVAHVVALGLEDEVVVELPLLDPADALAVLVERLSGTAIADDQRRDLERVVACVEGHPLALELVAGWIELLGASSVADQLESGLLPIATEGPGSIVDRVEITLGLVDPRVRAAFPRLGAFQADFDVTALSHVAELSPREASRVLRELRRVALIQPGRRQGWWRLLAGVRDAARELEARAGSADTAATAMLAWLRRVIEPARLPAYGLDAFAATGAVEPWQADLRAAIGAAADDGDLDRAGDLYEGLYWFWAAGGHLQDAVWASERLLPLCDAEPDHPAAVLIRAGYAIVGGTFAWCAAHLPQAELALAAAERSGDPMHLFMADIAVAMGAGWSGDLARTEQLMADAQRNAPPRSTHPFFSIVPHEYQGMVHIAAGRLAEGRHALEQACEDYESIGSLWGVTHAFTFLGWAATFEGDQERAEQCFRLTAERADASGDTRSAVHARVGLADLLAGSGRPHDARREYLEVLPELLERGDLGCAAQCLCGLAETGVATGDTESVEWLLADAASTASRAADGGVFARAVVGLGELALSLDQPAEAARLLGCLDDGSTATGRPLRAEETRRLDALRDAIGLQVSPAEQRRLVDEGRRRGAGSLIAEIRARLALTRGAHPLTP